MVNAELVDFVFRHYDDIYYEIKDRREHVHSEPVGGGGRCYISSPTETTAMMHMRPISRVTIDGTVVERPEIWLKVVESADKFYSYNKVKYQVMDMFYNGIQAKDQNGKPAYDEFRQPIMEYPSIRVMSDKTGLDRRTVRNFIEEFRGFAFGVYFELRGQKSTI